MEDRLEQEIDIRSLWLGIVRRIWLILGISILVAVVVWLWSRSQPAVYEASSVIIAANQGGDNSFGGAFAQAPPLPEGAVAQALQGTAVLTPLIRAIQTDPQLSSTQQMKLVNSLTKQLQTQKLTTLSLLSQLDTSGNGLYTLVGQASSAVAARELTDLATTALLNWDAGRGLQNVVKAQSGFRAQLAQIDRQLVSPSLSDVERQTLIARRATTQQNLAQVSILANSATGVLSRLSAAVTPIEPIAPKPTRNAALAGLLVFLLGVGVVTLLTLMDKTLRTEEDLLHMNVATLGVLPMLKRRDVALRGIVRAARQAGLYEAVGFLKVNLLTILQGKSHPVLMVSSTAPGEGKSSLTATLADGFASGGQRVLIIDADLRRGTQVEVWQKFNREGQWLQLTGEGGVRTTQEALSAPDNVQVLRVEENVDLLPAGPGTHDSLVILNHADLSRVFDLWRSRYDIVLIDSAPLLALADGLVLGPYTDGVVMVAEHGRTTQQAVRSVLRRAERNNLNLLGFVINKSSVQSDYGYGYEYQARQVVS